MTFQKINQNAAVCAVLQYNVFEPMLFFFFTFISPSPIILSSFPPSVPNHPTEQATIRADAQRCCLCLQALHHQSPTSYLTGQRSVTSSFSNHRLCQQSQTEAWSCLAETPTGSPGTENMIQ